MIPLYPRKKNIRKNHKTCAICKATKKLNKFAQMKATGQYHSYCKPCLAGYVLARYHATKEQK